MLCLSGFTTSFSAAKLREAEAAGHSPPRALRRAPHVSASSTGRDFATGETALRVASSEAIRRCNHNAGDIAGNRKQAVAWLDEAARRKANNDGRQNGR